MKAYTPRELRSAVIIAVALTAVAMLMLFDRSRRLVESPPSGSSHAIAP